MSESPSTPKPVAPMNLGATLNETFEELAERPGGIGEVSITLGGSMARAAARLLYPASGEEADFTD